MGQKNLAVLTGAYINIYLFIFLRKWTVVLLGWAEKKWT